MKIEVHLVRNKFHELSSAVIKQYENIDLHKLKTILKHINIQDMQNFKNF